MLTLTQAAILTKRAVIVFIVLFFLGISVPIGWNMYIQYEKSKLPPQEEQPELKFGDLPKLSFPETSVLAANYSFSLDTSTGGLPQAPKLIKVYFMPKLGVSLLALDAAKNLAASFNITTQPQKIDENNYKFGDPSLGEMSIDLTTNNFSFIRQLTQENTNATPSALPDQTALSKQFNDLLGKRNLLNDDLSGGKQSILLGDNENGNINQATLTIWPQPVDDYPIVTSQFYTGLITAIYSNDLLDENKFIQLKYIYWPVDKTTYSTYRVKSPEQAFEELKKGQGYISSAPSGKQISISNVYLAYFQSDFYQQYLQPIFVFEGPKFAGFVSAVDQVAQPTTAKNN